MIHGVPNKAGRNDPCPCGSGRKFKRCCLQAGTLADSAPGAWGEAVLHTHRGIALQSQGRLSEAAASYRLAVLLAPDFVEAHNNLGIALTEAGDAAGAITALSRALALRESPEIKARLAACLATTVVAGPGATALVARAITEAWARPVGLVRAGAAALKEDPEFREILQRTLAPWPRRLPGDEFFEPPRVRYLAQHPLLQALLHSAPVCDVELERFLTLARYALLSIAADPSFGDELDASLLRFHCALARQCFINGFVFSHSGEEIARAGMLRAEAEAALVRGDGVPPRTLAAIATYFPLSSLRQADALLRDAWTPPLAGLITQQVAEPRTEAAWRARATPLTGIDDAVSRQVREQYEEHPYPRWITPGPVARFDSLRAYLASSVPLAPPGDEMRPAADEVSPAADEARPTGDETRPAGDDQVLIAGCGTGEESIEMARRLPGARILALDLSLSSLSYAVRKTAELGLSNIEYAQADILAAASIGRTFDLITSVGVLHHMHDPPAGLRVLASLLRPGGHMRLGLYSEYGRRLVVAARELIAQRQYAADDEGIRRCREALMASAEFHPLTRYNDFFSAAECRDLLFHVQEHRFTLLQIKALLAAERLRFAGFALGPEVIRRYRQQFPAASAPADLDAWDRFEREHPHTFAGMYIFWVRKDPPATAAEA